MLLTTGRCGDCMVLLCSLLEDTDLMTYFACYPEEAADWTERLSRAPDWSDQVYRQGIQKFRMPHIWKKLKAKGIEPLGERDYSILSATVHASPWGTHFYGRTLPGDPGRLHLSLGAGVRSGCHLLSRPCPPGDLSAADSRVSCGLFCCQGSDIQVALNQIALRHPYRRLAG